MRIVRAAAKFLLAGMFAAALLADWIAPARYDEQFRDQIEARPGRRFPLGTDELGRDRFSRLLHGARVSLVLAPSAALLGTLLAGVIGVFAGMRGGWMEKAVMLLADLFLALPWLFLLLTVRAALPLNVTPWTSLVITFGLLSLLGWAGPARVIRTCVKSLKDADFLLQARALGCHPTRLVCLHVLPNLKAPLMAQFWFSVPAFILSEANLSLLGLGVAEPLPSLGALLGELENISAVQSKPWMLAPAVVLLAIMCCFQLIFPKEEVVG
jgi:peptide/nickel transport system permease protein